MSARVTFDQDVWWRTREGLTVLIDDMDDRHRANTAAMLMRCADEHYLLVRARRILTDWAAYEAAGMEAFSRGSWGPVDPDEQPTEATIRAEVGPEIAAGRHVEWLRSTPLYRRLVA